VTRSKWQERLGVGERLVRTTGRLSIRRPVTVEDGPRRGQIGGYHTEHRDGRVDATVAAPSLHVTTRTKEL
jgi:hypothetical protein